MSEEIFDKIREVVDIMKMDRNYRNYMDMVKEDGGPGSGNFGHEGRPGEIGGSAPGGGKKSGGSSSSSKKSSGGKSSDKGGSGKKSSSSSSKKSGSSSSSGSSVSSKINSNGVARAENLSYKEILDLPEGTVLECEDKDTGRVSGYVAMGDGMFVNQSTGEEFDPGNARTWTPKDMSPNDMYELPEGATVKTPDGRVWTKISPEDFMDLSNGEARYPDDLYDYEESSGNGSSKENSESKPKKLNIFQMNDLPNGAKVEAEGREWTKTSADTFMDKSNGEEWFIDDFYKPAHQKKLPETLGLSSDVSELPSIRASLREKATRNPENGYDTIKNVKLSIDQLASLPVGSTVQSVKNGRSYTLTKDYGYEFVRGGIIYMPRDIVGEFAEVNMPPEDS